MGEALITLMPIVDMGLAGLPAQVYGPAAAQGGEVDESQIQVLDDAAEAFDAMHEPDDLALHFPESQRRKRRAQSRQARGFACDVAAGSLALQYLDGKVASQRQQLFSQGRDLGDEGVGLIPRKILHGTSETGANVTHRRLVFVTGLSGAGKSQAMKTFEDLGYYCIDHLPSGLIEPALRILAEANVENVALAIDARGDAALGNPAVAVDAARTLHGCEVLFLDARDEVLVRRYSETRHRHPLAQSGTLREAIARERTALSPLRERATQMIDTSDLTQAQLRTHIVEGFTDSGVAPMMVTLVAFGFKYGLPIDLDLLFDVRFLRNPNYVETLRPLDGTHAKVAAFIEEDDALQPFLDHVTSLLDFTLPRYVAEGKTRLSIGVGCTGGQHRSVYVAERLARHYGKLHDVRIHVANRDVGRSL